MKFSGDIGFQLDEVEIDTDVWKPIIEKRHYTGDITKNTRKFQASENQNDNLTISNRISIVADLYMQQNWPSIRFVVWKGVAWKVTNVDVSYPRLTIDIGGVYNGEKGPRRVKQDLT